MQIQRVSDLHRATQGATGKAVIVTQDWDSNFLRFCFLLAPFGMGHDAFNPIALIGLLLCGDASVNS